MIAQRLAVAAIVATWSVPTIVVAQHAKAESTAAHATAPAKESAGEHASSPAKKDVAAEPVPHKSPAKEAPKDAGRSAAKPTSEHAEAKSDGKDKHVSARHVEEATRQAEPKEKSSAAKDGPRSDKGCVSAHASADRASSEKDAEPATSGGKKVASAAAARSKTAPRNELEAALKRIDEQIGTMRTSPAAAQPGKPRAANETRAVRPSPMPSVARVHLSWRTTLVWSSDLDGEADRKSDMPRVGLVWPATEPLKSTAIAPGLVSAAGSSGTHILAAAPGSQGAKSESIVHK